MAAKKGSKKHKKQAKKSAKKAKKRAASMAPKPVKTGKGATPLEIAKDFATLIRAGRLGEVEKKWLAPGIESVEGVGASVVFTGRKAVLAKYRAWEADHEIHEMRLDGPWVGATGFALRFWIDMTQKSTGNRAQMEEVAVYTVRNGKVVREEFHFALPG